MESIEVFMELFGGSVLLIGFGWLVGHLFKLDKFSDDRQRSKDLQLKNADGLRGDQGDLSKGNNF